MIQDCQSRKASTGLGHAIARREIPPDLAGLPVLGHGATSLVLAVSPDRVVMLTRDVIKAAWCQHALQGEILAVGRSRHPTLSLLNRFPVHRIALPRLAPLDGRNAAHVTALIDGHVAVARDAWSRHRDRGDQVRQVLGHYRADPAHAFHPLAQFLRRYRWFQADLDLTPDNFLQSPDGGIVLADPVITTRLQRVLERYRPAA